MRTMRIRAGAGAVIVLHQLLLLIFARNMKKSWISSDIIPSQKGGSKL